MSRVKKSPPKQPKTKSAKSVRASAGSARQKSGPDNSHGILRPDEYVGAQDDNNSVSLPSIFSQPVPSFSTPVSSYRKIGLSFLSLTLIMVLAIFYFTLARAEITIIPKPKIIKNNFKVTIITPVMDRIENKTPVMDRVENILQGEILATTVELRQTFPASQVEFEEKKARGVVTIINNYSQPQTLIRTTRLLSPENVLFRTDQTIRVPVYSQIQVQVYADKPGPEGEIGPSHFIIPGLWPGIQDKIFGESKEPMKGGLEERRIVTEDDIKKAKDEIEKKLVEKALEELGIKNQESKTTNYKLSRTRDPATAGQPTNYNLSLTSQEILETTINAKPGDQLDEFEMKMKLKLITIAFDEKELLALVQENLKDLVPQNMQLLSFPSDLAVILRTPTYSSGDEGSRDLPVIARDPDVLVGGPKQSRSYELILDSYNLEAKTATLKVYAQGQVVIAADNPLLNKNALIGKNEKEVKAYLEKFPEIESVAVKFSPFWVQRVPVLRDHIEIIIRGSALP